MKNLAAKLKQFLTKDHLYDWYSYNADCGQTDAFYDKESVDFEKLKSLIDEFSESFDVSDGDSIAGNTILDMRGEEIKAGDWVHFAHADSVNHLAEDAPIVYALNEHPYNTYLDESIGQLRVDRCGAILGVDHAEYLDHLDRMLNSGKAKMVSRANQ